MNEQFNPKQEKREVKGNRNLVSIFRNAFVTALVSLGIGTATINKVEAQGRPEIKKEQLITKEDISEIKDILSEVEKNGTSPILNLEQIITGLGYNISSQFDLYKYGYKYDEASIGDATSSRFQREFNQELGEAISRYGINNVLIFITSSSDQRNRTGDIKYNVKLTDKRLTDISDVIKTNLNAAELDRTGGLISVKPKSGIITIKEILDIFPPEDNPELYGGAENAEKIKLTIQTMEKRGVNLSEELNTGEITPEEEGYLEEVFDLARGVKVTIAFKNTQEITEQTPEIPTTPKEETKKPPETIIPPEKGIYTNPVSTVLVDCSESMSGTAGPEMSAQINLEVSENNYTLVTFGNSIKNTYTGMGEREVRKLLEGQEVGGTRLYEQQAYTENIFGSCLEYLQGSDKTGESILIMTDEPIQGLPNQSISDSYFAGLVNLIRQKNAKVILQSFHGGQRIHMELTNLIIFFTTDAYKNAVADLENRALNSDNQNLIRSPIAVEIKPNGYFIKKGNLNIFIPATNSF